MSKHLVTFSGKLGDVLWSLPTARLISQTVGERLDFGTMPGSRSLLPLLEAQPWCARAFVVEDWVCVHSNFGDQPWNPPKTAEEGYEQCWHLTYKGHPGINAPEMPLVDFIAYQQGMRFKDNPLPFVEVPPAVCSYKGGPFVAYAFNTQYTELKARFLKALTWNLTGLRFVDVSQHPWLVAVGVMQGALCFVGCRSANYVLAHGLGKRVFCYEPHPARNTYGNLGRVFGCPYGQEFGGHYSIGPEEQAQAAAKLIQVWTEEACAKSNVVPVVG